MGTGDYGCVIFICTDNMCQSMIAEALFKETLAGTKIESKSRGLVVLFSEPVDPKAEEIMHTHGLKLPHSLAKQFHSYEADKDTLILTMTEHQKKKVKEDYFFADNVFTLKEYAGESGDCIDPYGGNLLDYEDCYQEMVRLIKKVSYRILKEDY